MRTYHFPVGRAEAGRRIDLYVARHVPMTVSRAMIQRGIKDGAVRVNQRAVKANYRLRQGDAITAAFDLPAPPRDREMAPQALPLEIAYEDAALLVVNKPAGMVTHPAPGHWDQTLVNAVLWHLSSKGAQGSEVWAQGGGPEPPTQSPEPILQRAGIVHRLDKDTSGLLLVAKTPSAHAALSRQLKSRRIHRDYLALVEGHVPLDEGTVRVPIGRHATHRKLMTVRHLGGRSAVTHYRVLQRHSLRAQGSGLGASAQSPQPRAPSDLFYSALKVSLETGRTHQIRVHMAHAGYPILGDITYGRHPAGVWQPLGITRQLLHAYRLEFQHPVSGQPTVVSAPIPDDMARWLDKTVISTISQE